MDRHIRLYLCRAAILLLLMAGAPRPVRADGVPITIEGSEVEMPAQQAILVWDEERGHEDLILSVELLGSPEAAWVVPVPSLPEVKAASPKWFEYLIAVSRPRIEYREKTVYENGRCVIMVEMEVEKEAGVELLSREQVGVYDVSVLSADEPGALLDWLNEHGYAFPDEGGPILDAYVAEGGWYFVAARVLPGKSVQLDGNVQPLWFSFNAEQPIYPMRLTSLVGKSVQVLIYVLADHRMWARRVHFQTEFAGETKLYNLSVQETDTDLVDLLTHQPYYITKLHTSAFAPKFMTQDLYFERAESDEPYHKVVYRTRYVCPPATEAPPTKAEIEPTPAGVASEHAASEDPPEHPADQPLAGRGWLLLGVGLVLLGLLAGVGLVWRQRSQRKSDKERKA